MITLAKLKIYRSHYGDVDFFARSGRRSEGELLSDEEWFLIDRLILDAMVVNKHLNTEQQIDEATVRLKENSENKNVEKEIRRLAESDPKSW